MKTNYSDGALSSEQTSPVFKYISSQVAKTFVVFGGQGIDPIPELRSFYEEGHSNSEFWDIVFSSIDEVSEQIERDRFHKYFPFGFQLREWLNQPESTPNHSVLKNCSYSIPLIFLAQASSLFRIVKDEVNWEILLKETSGIFGHSQGVYAGLLLSSSSNKKSFLSNLSLILKNLIHLGIRAQEEFPILELDVSSKKYIKQDETPSPMAAIKSENDHLLLEELEKFNSGRTSEDMAYLGLKNGPKIRVICGSPETLLEFRNFLSSTNFPNLESWVFLKISAPFHSPLLRRVPILLENDAKNIGFNPKPSDLRIPLYDTRDGRDLREESDLAVSLSRMAVAELLDWDVCLESLQKEEGRILLLSFGPGSDAEKLCIPTLRGKSYLIRNISKPDLYRSFSKESNLEFPKSWKEFQPETVELPNGRTLLKNNYSVWTGRPPIFGGGMTPSTVEPGIVIAAAKDGYLVEWAGGGQVTEELFRKRIEIFRKELPQGVGIVINLLYLDAYLWNLQVPLVKRLKSEGAPIEGVTISAGIPETEEAVKILKDFEAHGIWLNSFKPGTQKQIRQVISIANKMQDSKILMQIEGGAAGGHHSWEDLEDLVRSTYSEIRECKNIILAVGGGIAEPEDSKVWLFGTWAGKNPMPVDAVFLGTRLMAAKECATSEKIKQSLVSIAGSETWKKTQEGKNAGGIISGRSGLGADIYYAENSWTKLSSFAEELTKGKESEEARRLVLEKKNELISLIDSTAKPYFGDLEEMSYSEILFRYLELTCPGEKLRSPEGNWPDHPFIDKSYRTRFLELARRFESRVSETSDTNSILENIEESFEPKEFLQSWELKYSNAGNIAILPEDRIFFLDVCKRPGKPVNFIPVIDEDLVKWIRSDSLWYSHCIGMDPDTCAWIPGPKAIRGIYKVNEPISEIFGSFLHKNLESSRLKKISWKSLFESSEPSKNIFQYFPEEQIQNNSVSILENIDITQKDWALALSDLGEGFLSAVLKSSKIGPNISDIRSILEPRIGRKFIWETSSAGELILIQILENNKLKIEFKLLEKDSAELQFLFYNPKDQSVIPFQRRFYPGKISESFIEEDLILKERSGLELYLKTWGLDGNNLGSKSNFSKGLESEITIDKDSILNFRKAIGELRRADLKSDPNPPLGMSTAFAWKVLLAPLFTLENRNLFKLLHFSQKFRWEKEITELVPGDTLRSKAKLAKLRKLGTGQEIQIQGEISKDGKILCSFQTGFLIRDVSSKFDEFDSIPLVKTIIVRNQAELNLLHSIPWIQNLKQVQIGTKLKFSSDNRLALGLGSNLELNTIEGTIERISGNYSEEWGKFKLEEKVFVGHSSFDRLLSLFEEVDPEISLQKPYKIISEIFLAPSDMSEYSSASGDTNPIHTDPDFAKYAGWKDKIVHGLWTSSRVIKQIVIDVCEGDPSRMISFDETFEAPVYLGEELLVEVSHISQWKGNQVLSVNLKNRAGETKLGAKAIVSPKKTGYVFTGQGSQSQGMGMKLREEFSEAKKIWQRAENTTRDELGFSLLKIVQDNPTSLKVGKKIWNHPKGVLHLTQFTQVALVTKSMADWEVLKERGFLDQTAPFAGHSLGEFSALSARGFLGLENVIRIVYGRGLTMQGLVPRDSEGRSPFGMSVVLGNRHVGLDEATILKVVKQIKEETGLPLEVVNLNIRDKQYSVTGDLKALSEMESRFKEIVRGKKTTIRLEGIDVPFHSRVLVNGVSEFRKTLESNIPADSDFEELDGKYIPNLVAKPFSIHQDFIKYTAEVSGSPILNELLKGTSKLSPKELRRTLLIELLAYQFAMPVQWILTQDQFFQNLKVKRLIDLGARGDLAGMAKQTIREESDPSAFEILHIEENRNQVLYESEDCENAEFSKIEETPEILTSNIPTENIETPKIVSVQVQEPVREIQVSGGDEASVILTKKDALLSLLSLKAGVRPEEISEEESIDTLFGGNSSKRNQVMADLGAEFKTPSLDGAHEKSIKDLVKLLEEQSAYTQPGPYLRTSFEETLKKFFPPDFGRTEVFKHLKEERSLSSSGIFAITVYLPLYAREGDSIRKGALSPISLNARFGNSKAASSWLDNAVDLFAQSKGIRIGKVSSSGSGSSGGAKVDAAALEELEKKYFGIEGIFGKTIKDFRKRLLGEDPFIEFLVKDLNTLEEARSKNLADTSPVSIFQEKKIVRFSNSEQWAKKKLLQGLAELRTNRRETFTQEEEHYFQNQKSPLLLKVLEYWDRLFAQDLNLYPDQKKRIEPVRKHLQTIGKSLTQDQKPVFRSSNSVLRPNLSISEEGNLNFKEVEYFTDLKEFLKEKISIGTSRDQGSNWEKSPSETESVLGSISKSYKEGISFSGLKVLVTGGGPNSIALETVYVLLSGGADVILTTTSYSSEKVKFYKQVFQKYGAKGSSISLVPFSQGSLEDIRLLSEWLIQKDWEPDVLIPFGAVGEENSTSQLDDSSLNSLRVMLLGVEKLIGTLGRTKNTPTENSPLHVILPLSPNHGIFGRDGMYAETKLGLETLFRKKFSEEEDWGKHTRIHGCVIGWVRGTGLMEANDLVSQALEERSGVLTFSRREMGLLLGCLIHHSVFHSSEKISKANFTGGLDSQSDLGKTLAQIRNDILSEAKIKKETFQLKSKFIPKQKEKQAKEFLPKEVYKYPSIPDENRIKEIGPLNTLDLSKTVCIVGFAELGPAGSSNTRWELEKSGILSLEASLELAWMMGFVKYQASDKGRSWTDSETGEAVEEWEIKSKYEEKILAHTGIRIIDKDCVGFDPSSLFSFVDVVLEEDFFVPVSNAKEAEEFKNAEPEATEVYHDPEKDKWFVRRKKGSQIKVRKTIDFTRKVAGQIPKGWDAAKYGIPKDLVKQVDPITVYNLYCTCEAFLRSGMEPIELYKFIHPGLVGSTVGSGMGGMGKLKRMFQDFLLGKERQHDALQESLINVTAAWALTSYVGGYGPVQTPVAACATAGVSLEMAASLIKEGKAGFMLAGAFDDFAEEGLVGFGDMQATASSIEMAEQGIDPTGICRPNDIRRGGFVEAQGGGIILLARGDLALEAGLPVYGILAYAGSKTDGIQASIPAPGLGLLTLGAESEKEKSPLRNALSAFGLTADDIGVAYKHDTSTKANDKNENKLLFNLLSKLGRTPGNLLPVVSQKSLTGHSKGGAAAWQTIGVLQSLEEGIVTGNRNLEEVDPDMNEYEFVTFTDESITFGKHNIKAGMLTTLGFGHVGALCLFVHSDYFLAALSPEERTRYLELRKKRETKSRNRYHEIRMGLGKPLYERHTKSYFPEEETGILLNAAYRSGEKK